MRYYLENNFVLKRLETPALYGIQEDELYELDETAFEFLRKCSRPEGCSADGAGKEFIEYCLSEKILSDTSSPTLRRPESLPGSSAFPSLRYLELQITDRCNLKCRHCYIDKPGQNELSPEVIKDILCEFDSMQGLRLLITGGEPLLHRSFGAINDLLPGHGFRKILFTNGLLLEKMAITELNVDEIQFSVDGMEHGHDALRGSGSYNMVMHAIKAAIAAGKAASVSTMVHRENTGEFAEMERLFKDMDIRDWTVDVPCLTGNLKQNATLNLPPEVAGPFLNYGFGGGLHGGGEGYACGLHLLSVLANGAVSKCAFYGRSPLGTVSEGLRKCWERLKPVKLEELECARLDCKFMDACRGGCRYRASIADNESGPRKRDIYKCFAYGIIE
ncbi:MAG: radical SAM protein [Nitrospirae bacterium]|nr:radical SAM protein [Nitrospirota bacterium]